MGSGGTAETQYRSGLEGKLHLPPVPPVRKSFISIPTPALPPFSPISFTLSKSSCVKCFPSSPKAL